ncbi:MAG: ABC transporter permease [Phycisphaerales bacterium]|nr:ABC transporter permease [Phycisphaerales bacterium]
MNSAAALSSHADPRRLPPTVLSNVLTIGKRELRDAVRSRWFLLYTIAFAALGLAVSFVSAAGSGGTGLSGYGRTTAGLVNLVLLVVPLMALTAGAATIASDRERGMLSYILAQPVRRNEVLIGKYLGLLGALLACIFLGLGFCTLVLAWKGQRTSAESMLWLGGLSLGLAAGMLSVGVLVSTLVRRASVAVGTAIFIWLSLVFVTDLGLMAGAVALRLPIRDLFALSLINPLQVFKMWTLHAVDANLDVLGPAGLYAAEEFGARLHLIFGGCLAAWVLVPLGIAGVAISRRSPL